MKLSYAVMLSLSVLSILNAGEMVDSTHVTNQLTGMEVKTSTGGGVIQKQRPSGIYNYDEVAYEHIKAYQLRSNSPQEGQSVALGEDIKARRLKDLESRKTLANAIGSNLNTKQPQWPKFAEGYCYVKNPIEVEKIATYAYMTCDFAQPIGRAELVASLVPDFYAMALVAKPLYVTIMDKSRKKQRVPVGSGVVMTQNKLSINLANVVNDRKIEKLVAAGTYTTLNAATQQAQTYLTDLRASRVKEQVDTTSTIGGVVTTKTTNVEKPVASDYVMAGGLQIVSELAKIIGESVVNSLPYTFKVNKDSVWFADLELGNESSLRGYDPDVKNVITRQPVFDITKGREADYSVTNIPIRPSNTPSNATPIR